MTPSIRRLLMLFCCVLFAGLFAASPALAGQPSASVVYVAGNPDLYPIEYYDASEERYCGLMPDLYRLISEKTGYSFEYLHPGSQNGQARMAKNGQAEIISAYQDGEIPPQDLQNPLPVTVIQTETGEKSICIAFSEIASEKLIADISEALGAISDSQKLGMLVSYTASNGRGGEYRIFIYILSGVLLLFLLAAFAVVLVWRKRQKKSREDTMLDPESGIGNDQYYVYCFKNLISEKSKALYYVAYIAFDERSFNQKFGDTESRDVQRYSASFLSRQTTNVDYLAQISHGVYTFIYQAANKTAAVARVSALMRELDLYLTNIKSEYSKLFHAGVCVLDENMDATAETAFYSAKQGYLRAISENHPFALSTKAMITQAHRREGLHRRVMQAIEQGEFLIYLQFIVDRKGNLFGAEAVSRWQHPQEGLLTPSQYIEMINQSDAITLHDFYIFSLVCRQLELWKNSGRKDLHISCNFTRYSLTSPGFFERIREAAEKYDFDRHKLILEITEDSLSSDAQLLKENIQKCKDFGFTIALDDIGDGYSALGDLYKYPLDIVKVERKIVLQAMEPRGKMLLDGLIRLAHSMNMKVLCEGVETAAQNDMIFDTQCEYIQGFFYSRALPLKEAERYLQQHGFSQ